MFRMEDCAFTPMIRLNPMEIMERFTSGSRTRISESKLMARWRGRMKHKREACGSPRCPWKHAKKFAIGLISLQHQSRATLGQRRRHHARSPRLTAPGTQRLGLAQQSPEYRFN